MLHPSAERRITYLGISQGHHKLGRHVPTGKISGMEITPPSKSHQPAAARAERCNPRPGRTGSARSDLQHGTHARKLDILGLHGLVRITTLPADVGDDGLPISIKNLIRPLHESTHAAEVVSIRAAEAQGHLSEVISGTSGGGHMALWKMTSTMRFLYVSQQRLHISGLV